MVGAFFLVNGKKRTSAEGPKFNSFIIVGIVILALSVVLFFVSLTLGIVTTIRRRRFERDNEGNDEEENDEVKDWRPSPGSMVCSTPPPSYAFIIQTDRQGLGAQDETVVAVPSSFVLSMPSGSHAPAMIVANVMSLIADDDELQPPPTYADAARLIKQLELESSNTVAGTFPVTSDVNA